MLKQPFHSQKMIISTLGRTFQTLDRNPLISSSSMASHSSSLEYFGHSRPLLFARFKRKVTRPHNRGHPLWSQLPVVPPKLSPFSPAFTAPSPLPLLSFSLQGHTHYLYPEGQVVYAPRTFFFDLK